MKIFFLSAEAYPFAKTGGLADAVSSLAKALSLAGHQVNILLPRYYSINKDSLTLVKKDVFVSLGPIEVRVNFYQSQLDDSSINVYFMDFEKFFGREGIYGPTNTSEYKDNPVRFSLFCRSLFRLCECIDFKPDIIHVHDWASALAPVFLKYQERKNSFFSDTKSVITVHNAAYQGKFPVDSYKFLGLPEELRFPAGFEDSYSVNFLKAGLTSSDWITTVSPSYAKEIQCDQFGEGLAGLYRVRSSTLTGILNGIDDKVWSPEIDKNLPANYSIENFSGKALCKEAVQKKFGLQVNSSVPVISLISRLVPQKGISEVFAPMYGAIYKICTELPLQFIVIGSGEEWCQKEILSLSSRLDNFKAYVGYDDALSHLTEAGSDLFLMPSKYEPCGLNQMYSMRYGTLPIVRNTGGLKDSVENYNPAASDCLKGTGFVFDFLTPEAIFNTVKWAVESWYSNKRDISQMIKNAMTKDFSWKKSAQEYIEVYKNL
ncbi:MAG: glycogen synthase [Treponema sp.]|nr:glycogen synthase [Treponema sp.]